MPAHSSKRFLAPLSVPLLLAATTILNAQTITLDEGSFRILVGGREAGTETFSILQSGTRADAQIIARGTVTLDTAGIAERLSATLDVDGQSLRPAAYQVMVEGTDQQRIAGRIIGGRFSAKILSPTGEQMREYLASEGAVLVDEGVAHHYYFLARRLEGGSARIPIIIPRQNRQVSAEVAERGRETVEVGGRRIEARHLVITPAGGSERRLWVDSQGRVLRLEIPARSYVARRVAPPR